MIELKLTDEQAFGLLAALRHGIASETMNTLGFHTVHDALYKELGEVVLSEPPLSAFVVSSTTNVIRVTPIQVIDCR